MCAAVYWLNVLKGVTDTILYLFYFIIKHGMMNKWKRDKKVKQVDDAFWSPAKNMTSWKSRKKLREIVGYISAYLGMCCVCSTYQHFSDDIRKYFKIFLKKQTLYSTYILADWLNVVIRRSKKVDSIRRNRSSQCTYNYRRLCVWIILQSRINAYAQYV